MIFVTAKKGKNHVTSQQFRGIVAAMAGTESYIADMDEHLEPELAVNNTIKIRSGTLIHHGGVMVVKSGTYDEVTYQNGTQAMKRIDLVVARYTQDTATGTENAEWVVIQGQPAESNPVAPDYIHGNMQDGDLADDCPIFELHFDGINVTEVRKLINIMQSVDELNRKLDQESSTKVMGFSFLRRGNEVLMTHNSILEVVEAGHVYTNQGSIPMGYRPALNLSAIPGLITDGNNKIRGTWWLVANSTGSINVISSITHSDPLSYVTSASWPTSDVINL